MTDVMPELAPEKPFFSARLTPHRSLGSRGFFLVMALVSGVAFTAGIVFWQMGAWPVLGFFGLDIALVLLAFHLSYKSGRTYETVELSHNDLVIRHVTPQGHTTEVRLNPYWAKFHMDVADDQVSSLTVAAEGQSVRLGQFLPPTEKEEFGLAFQKALKTVSVFS